MRYMPNYDHFWIAMARRNDVEYQSMKEIKEDNLAAYRVKADMLNKHIRSNNPILYDDTPIMEFEVEDSLGANIEVYGVVRKRKSYKESSKRYNVGIDYLQRQFEIMNFMNKKRR